MTVTVRPRRVAVVVAVAIGVLAAYLIGSSRTASAVATAPAGVPGATTMSALSAAGSSGATPGITVSGIGTVSGTPDTLVVSLSVSANGASVSSAFASANAAMGAVQKALTGKGVAPADMQTSNVSVQQQYDTRGRANGYQVVEGLTVTVHDIGRASDDIAAAVAAGRNLVRVDGVSLDLKDTGPLVNQARDDAFADARRKAEQYAHAAGRTLGAVVTVQEITQAPQPYPYAYESAAGLPAALRPPIQAGSQDVAVQVTVTFALA
jgi:uncharacterized protein